MRLKDYFRLQKLMMMTTSENDNEALSALRSANTILKAESLDWNKVFARTVQVINEFEPAPSDQPGDGSDVDEAFATVMEGHESEFISSLYDQWQRKRWLSPAQRDALFKTAQRERKRR